MNPVGNQHYVNIPSASSTQSRQPLPLNLPCQDLLDDGRREEYVNFCVRLYNASIEADWEAAKGILDRKQELVRFSVNGNNETALHVAVSRGHTKFVKNLMNLMEAKDLELQDNSSYTALCIAVTNGDVEMAKLLVQKNEALPNIPTSQGIMPLQLAASSGKLNMLNFLYEISQNMQGDFWTPENRSSFLLACVEADFFGLALQVLKDRPELALRGGNLLGVLAQKPQAFESIPRSGILGMILPVKNRHPLHKSSDGRPALKLLRFILKNITDLSWAKVYDILRGPIDAEGTYSSRVLFLAAEVGNIRVIVEIIQQYPELIYEVNDMNQSIFHLAVSHRHAHIYGLLYEIGSAKDGIVNLEDKNGNNMLHLMGIYKEISKVHSYVYIPGAVSEMRRELLWYKDVERMLPFTLRKKKNFSGKTPREEFTKHHKDLVSAGEKWLKDTGAQFMVVAALLATISFAATITFAGGYNQDNGSPVLRKSPNFPLFIILNCIAFLSASASIISVISLLTSRYAEDDFEISLPIKMLVSVEAIFISLTLTMQAFSVNLFLLYEKKSQLLPTAIFITTMLLLFVFFQRIHSLVKRFHITTVKDTLQYKTRLLTPVRARPPLTGTTSPACSLVSGLRFMKSSI